jgi:hypothetical protein
MLPDVKQRLTSLNFFSQPNTGPPLNAIEPVLVGEVQKLLSSNPPMASPLDVLPA